MGAIMYILLLAFLLSACSATLPPQYVMGGLKDTNMEITPCWVQPANSELWYPCDAEAVKDKECLNLMELAMKSVEEDILGGNKPTDKTVKLWQRAKHTCWSDLKDLQEKHYH